MIKKKTSIAIFFSVLFVLGCTMPITKNDVQVKSQRIIYDSINYKGNEFNINLYTTLEFKKNKIQRKEYNDFLLIFDKDTFPLIPQINNLEINKDSEKITIEYLSYINLKSKVYDNDSIFKLIKNKCRIINEANEEILNDSTNINSFITMRKIETNFKSE